MTRDTQPAGSADHHDQIRTDPFPSTLWSMVRLAVAAGEPGSERALDQLCRLYERPILAYILRHGYPPDEAEDLKQAFFEHLLEKNALAGAEATRVKLRAFLVTKLQGFLIDQHRRQMAQKRGAGRVANFADLSETEARRAEAVDPVTPFVVYQRQWMETLAANALARLRAECAAKGSDELFVALAPFLTNSSEQSIAALAIRFGRPEGTLKSDIFRLRAKCQQLIREEIAATLDDPSPENIGAELEELMGFGR